MLFFLLSIGSSFFVSSVLFFSLAQYLVAGVERQSWHWLRIFFATVLIKACPQYRAWETIKIYFANTLSICSMPGLNSSLYCTSELHNYLCLFLAGWYLSALDNVFLAIYFMEIVLKLYALRSFFFKTGWNIMGMTKRVFVFILGSQSCVGFSKYIEKLKKLCYPPCQPQGICSCCLPRRLVRASV